MKFNSVSKLNIYCITRTIFMLAILKNKYEKDIFVITNT